MSIEPSGIAAATPRAPALDRNQAAYLLQLIGGNDPLHLHFQSPLWTSALVAEVVRDEFELDLDAAQVMQMLMQLGVLTHDPWAGLAPAARTQAERWLRAQYAAAQAPPAPPWLVQELTLDIEDAAPLNAAGGVRRRPATVASAFGPRGELLFHVLRSGDPAAARAEFLRRLRSYCGLLCVYAPALAGAYAAAEERLDAATRVSLLVLEAPADGGGDAGLFRAEAVAARQRRLEGEVLIAQPLPLRLLTAGLVASLVALGVIASFTRYARTESATGMLMPGSGAQRLGAQVEGVIASVEVALGDRVQAGQALVRIDSARRDADGAAVDERVAAELEQNIAHVDSELAGLEQQQALDRADREAALSNAQRIAAAAAQAHALQLEREHLLADKVERQRVLVDKGILPKLQWQELQEAALASRMQTLAAAREAQAASADAQAAKSRVEQFPALADQQRHALEQRRGDLNARLAQARLAAGSTLTAPRAGRVAALLARRGERTTPARTLVVIVDADAPLEAELLLPSRAVGFVRPGQEVDLKLDAFPYQRFGFLRGRVREVATSAVAAQDTGVLAASGEPVYPLHVTLERQTMDAFGEQRPLSAGMQLNADIVIDRPRLLDWVLEPLYSLRGR